MFFHILWKLCLTKWEENIENSKDCPSSPRFPLRTTWEIETAISKFWLCGGQRLKLYHDVDGCPLHFWPSEWPDSKFELDANKNNTSKPFLDTFRRPQMIDLWLFLLRSKWTVVTIVKLIKPEVKIEEVSNFHHLLLFNHFIATIIFNWTKRLFLSLFFHFPRKTHKARYYSQLFTRLTTFGLGCTIGKSVNLASDLMGSVQILFIPRVKRKNSKWSQDTWKPKQAEKSWTCMPNLFLKLVHNFIAILHFPNYLKS